MRLLQKYSLIFWHGFKRENMFKLQQNKTTEKILSQQWLAFKALGFHSLLVSFHLNCYFVYLVLRPDHSRSSCPHPLQVFPRLGGQVNSETDHWSRKTPQMQRVNPNNPSHLAECFMFFSPIWFYSR